MNIKTYSHNYAINILSQEPFKGSFNELLWVCENIPLPIYKNKSQAQKKLDVIQQIMDTYIHKQLKTLDWLTDEYLRINDDSIRLDYIKELVEDYSAHRIHLEVEFGNVASSYRNYFKLQLSYLKDKNVIGIIILPTETLSKRIDSGVASFEKTVNELKYANALFNFPVLVIGLDDNNSNECLLNKSELSLKELQNKTNIKHELFVIDLIKKMRN